MELRRNLRLHWDSIVAMLQLYYRYAHTAADLARTSDRVTMIETLKEIAQICERCRDMARNLVAIPDITMITYHSDDINAANVDPKRGSKRRKGTSQSTSVLPAGEESGVRFGDACKDLSRGLNGMVGFLDRQLEICEHYLDLAKDSRRKASLDEAAQFAKMWEADEKNVLEAIRNIRRMGEAVMVPPPKALAGKNSSCIVV